MQALTFLKGNIYNIISKNKDQSLKIAQDNPAKYNKSRVVGANFNPQDNGQLFMVEKVINKQDGFEIANCISGLVFDEESEQIRLRPGSQSSDQLFAVTNAPIQGFYKYYWIKTNSKGEYALSLQGILRVKKFDPNDETQLFRFQLAYNNNTLTGSSIIINRHSGKALDVPEASFKKEERIIQWEKNKRFNQRWVFIKCGKGILIQSVLNNLVLDIAGESRKPGSKVIQWEKTGNSNQQWIPEFQNGAYRFRSVHQPSLYLSIDDQSVKDGGKLQVNNFDGPSSYWIVEGHQPV